MKKQLKRLLFTALIILLGGVNTAWAAAGDVVTNANIDFSNAISDGVVAGTVNSMTIGSGEIAKNGDTGWLSVYDATSTVTIPEAQRAGSKDIVNIQFKTAWGNKNSMGFGFNLKDAEGKALAEFKYARWDGNSTNSNTMNINMSGLVGGHNGNKPIAARYTMFDITINYAAKTITSVVYCNNTDGKGTTATQTFNVSLTNSNPIATFNIFGYGVGGNTDRANIFDDLIIKTTEGDYSVETYDYTVNWECNGTPVKSAVRQGEANASITLLDTDKTPFWENNKKYFYVSDNASEKTVSTEGDTEVTITVREAESWNYTVQAVDESENILGTLVSSTVLEGENIYYYYPIFYLSGTNLLQADINDKTYGKGATPSADNSVYNVIYKNKSISNVVFYKECEDIDGLTEINAGNVPVRCSNGKGAMASTATTITTLAPGKYKISGFAWGNTGTIFTLTANEATVATFTTVSSTVSVSASEEFTLSKPTNIVLGAQGNGGSSPKVIDFIYIQKTGEYDGEYLTSTYTADFNTAITTSAHDFQVASNWRHIVGTYSDYWGDTAYPSYSYSASAGVDGSAALSCSTNQSSNSLYDLLVTPYVKGNITIDAKATASYYTPQLTFYKINEDAEGNLTRGEQITVDVSEVNASDYTTITIPVTEFGRIGIRSSYVWLDNFKAENAIIVPEPRMTIASADPTATTGTIKWEQQANGKVLVKYTVTVTNTGDIDLMQGAEGYSVSIFNRSTGDVYGTTPVPQDLAVGATSDPFEVSAEVETTLWPNTYTYINMDLRENLMKSTVQRAQSTYTAYEPKFVFRAAGSTATSSITTAEAWGTITESTTKNFEIANTGTAPLTIKSITLPEGFTSTDLPVITEDGLVIAKGESQTFAITQDASAQGTFAGTLTIVYLDKDAAEQTYTLAFSTTVIGENTWTADFNNSSSTVLYPAGSVAEGGINKDYQYISSGNYNNWLVGRTGASYQTSNNKFITPKLHANAGDKLAFDVKATYSASDEYFVKVYVSADRQTWGEPVETYVYSNVGSSFTTKTISFDEAGDYYVAFALYGTGSGIDNIFGLEKVAVAHDLYIKSVSWPDASVKSGSAQTKPSVDIIPLTDEAAENYTVKYIYGENEVEIASKALTASANSTTNFAASFTPEVETTTTFPGTKVVFEFTDGTKFETETFDLTVTNEPIFHFQNAKYTSRWYEPSSDYTTPYNFGKTNEEASKTFWILNWGSAPLTVKSITVPEGFTTSVSTMALPAFDGTQDGLETCQQSFDVTFTAAEAGTYGGNLVVKYVNGAGEDATFELAISGTKLDPTKWYANFGAESNQWPAGSVYQSNISTTYVNTGDYALTSTSTTDNIFVTPKLTAAAGDKLLFDAKLYNSNWSEGAVKVYAATTREEVLNAEEGTTRKQLFYASGNDGEADATITTDYQTFEVTVAEAGEYYFGFEISDRPYVDELYGLSPVAVAHDWKIASSNIPAEAMQNVASTATVNILNLGLAEETADSYTVTAYVDGVAVATGTAVAIPVNHKLSDAGTKLSVSFRSPKVGTFPVYVEVQAGDYSVATEPVDVTFAEEVAVAEAIEIGSSSSSESYNYAPIDFFNFEQARTSDILYKAQQLTAFGLKSGDKMTKLEFKGTISSGSGKTLSKSSLKAWVALSTGDITFGSPDKESMTEVTVFEAGDMVFVAGTNMVTINLPKAITYDGSSDLRIYLEGGGNSEYVSLYFAYDTNYSNMKWSNATGMKYNPLLYVTLAVEPSFIAGTVNGAEGAATVTLVSTDGDNVQYAGTVKDGAYNVNVIQTGREYDVTVSDETTTSIVAKDIDFVGGSVTKNFDFGTLTLDGDATAAPADAVYAKVDMGRDLKQGWNAVVLPFAVDAGEIASKFGATAVVVAYDGDEVENDEKVMVKFTTATEMEANVPYLVKVAADVTAPEFQNADVAPAAAKTEGSVFDFVGLYAKTDVDAGDYFVKGGKFVKATTNNSVLAYRSYLKLHEGAEARGIRFFVDDEEIDGAVTGIEVLRDAEKAAEGIYNVSGQKMNGQLRKGLYIQNGKKVVIK